MRIKKSHLAMLCTILAMACSGKKEEQKAETAPTANMKEAILGDWSVLSMCIISCQPLDSLEVGYKMNMSFFNDGKYSQKTTSPSRGENEIKGTYKLEGDLLITNDEDGSIDTATVSLNDAGIEVKSQLMRLKMEKVK